MFRTIALIRALPTIVFLATIASNAMGQSWNALGDGVDGPIYCLAVYKNQLYVGGKFTAADGAPAPNIARWDGEAWFPLGSGTNGAVRALLVYDGQLYVGGDFTSCDGLACSFVARWDGSVWSPFGSGLNGPVFSMTEYQRTLYVGGDFTSAGSTPVNRIAVWDGDVWRQVAGGVNGAVYALEVTASSALYADVYVGGAFAQQDLARIAWYHPAYQTWIATVWGGFNAPVFAFANYDGGLVAGGSFTATGAGSRVNRLAQRGSDFYGGADGDVYALHAEGSHLYAGGSFRRVGPAPGLEAANIASWNGGSWEALGSGTNDTVRALVVFQGLLYAGGEFDSAGGVAVNHVARWGAATSVGSARVELPVSIRLLQNYPNPFNPSTTIGYELPRVSEVQLTVFTTLGLRVVTLVEGEQEAGCHEVQFDASGLASGVYLYQLRVRPPDLPPLDSASGRDSESGTALGRDSRSGAWDVVQTKRLLLLK
jgi:hypothetical protein